MSTRYERIAADHIDTGDKALVAHYAVQHRKFWLRFEAASKAPGRFDLSPAACLALVAVSDGREPIVESVIAAEIVDWCQELPDFFAADGTTAIEVVFAD